MNLRTATRRPAESDAGASLVLAVIAILVLGVLTTTLGVLVVNTAGVTGKVRGSLQAQAAADGGIAAGVAEAQRSVASACSIALTSSSAPRYTVTSSCPAGANTVEFHSVGQGDDGRSATAKAVFEYTSTPTVAPPTAGGPGLFYTYGLNTRLNSYVFDAANSEVGIGAFAGAAGVYATGGDIRCGTGSVFPGDIYTKTGSLQLDSGCVVKGTAFIGGKADVNGGSIEGSLVAPKNDNHVIAGTIGTTGGPAGDVFVGGTFTLNNGTVNGSATAAGSGNSTLGSGRIKGNFTYRGSFGVWGTPATTIVQGSITRNTTLSPPALPTIPDWQDVGFAPVNATTPPAAWAADGYSLITVTGAACNKWSGNSADVTSVAGALTGKTIFDIRQCTGNFDTNAGGARKDVKVNRDIAIIANRWYLSGTKFASADGLPHTIFLITPDSQPTVAGPQCHSPASNSEQLNDSSVDPTIAVYIYTPCLMKFNSGPATFRGQVYSGQLEFGGGVRVAFAPRHIPGYDFGAGPGGGGGGGGAAGGTYTLGALLSRQDAG